MSPISPFGFQDNVSDVSAADFEAFNTYLGAYADSLANGSGSEIVCFGHSQSYAGGSVRDLEHRWPSRVAAWIGGSERNESISGSILGYTDDYHAGGISWMAQRIQARRTRAPYASPFSAAILHQGTNDINNLGMASTNAVAPTTAGLAIFKNALRSALSLLRVSGRFYAGDLSSNLDASIVLGTPANWAAVANPAAAAGTNGSGAVCGSVGYIRTSTNGAGGAVTITVPGDYPGSNVCPLYIMFVADPTLTAGTITASGAATGTFDLFQSGGRCDTVRVVRNLVVWRFTGASIAASNGVSQTLTLTPSGLTGGPWGLAEWGIESDTPPLISMHDINRPNPATALSVWSKVLDADYATWNAGIQAVVGEYDSTVVYVPMDATAGGSGSSLGTSTTTATWSSATSPANGGTTTVASTSGWPASGTLLLDTELVRYTVVNATTITVNTRGAWNSVAASHASAVPLGVVNESAIKNFANDGLHWSEYGHALATGNVVTALQSALTNRATNQYRIGPGASLDVRATLQSTVNQIVRVKTLASAAQPIFFDRDIVNTGMGHDPAGAPGAFTLIGAYDRIFCQSDGEYLASFFGTWNSGKDVSSGATAAAGRRLIYIGRFDASGSNQYNVGSHDMIVDATNQGGFYPPFICCQSFPFEWRVGQYLQVYGFQMGAGVATTLGALMSASTPGTSQSITVASGTGIVNNDYLSISDGTNPDEIVLVTAGGGTTTLTVTRGQYSTLAPAHSNGATVASGVSIGTPRLSIIRIRGL